MINTFDITDYGACGDRCTDCTAAIQRALDDASKCKGRVIVPPGEYLTGRLQVKGKGVSIVGDSAWNFRSLGASALILNDKDADCLLDISGAFGVYINGLSLSGENLGKNIHGIKLHWEGYNGGAEEDTPTVDDCKVCNFTGDGLHFSHVWCFSVRHSMISSNHGAGLYIDGWDAFIIDNWFTGNGGGGILGSPVVASITCTGNRVEWNGKGGMILERGGSYNITGNFFDRSAGPALVLGSDNGEVGQVTVTGNIFKRSGAYYGNKFFEDEFQCSHLIMKNCNNSVVCGNTAVVGKDDGESGNTTPYFSFIVTDCKDCIIKDNTMANGYLKQGIILNGNNESCVIENNIGS